MAYLIYLKIKPVFFKLKWYYIHTLKQAISKYGIANRIYCDNGQVFLSAQIKRIAAQIGTRIIHTKIRDAAAKGKIERWFLTVRNRFLNGILPQKKVKTIQELNDLFNIFVSDYNNTVHSSIDSTPLPARAFCMIPAPHVAVVLDRGDARRKRG